MTDDERQFLTEFESCTLPFERWTHRAHDLASLPRITTGAAPDRAGDNP